MGNILNQSVDEDVVEEFQNCGLYPHDTRNIHRLFLEFRKLRMRAMDGKHFGLRINAKQLSEWKGCSLEKAQKLISRWQSIIAVKRSNTKQKLELLNKSQTMNRIKPNQLMQKRKSSRQSLRKSLSRSLSDINSLINLKDIQKATKFAFNDMMTDDTEISMLPLFCAMTLISSGTVSEKLKLIIYLFVDNPHDSVSRKKLDVIIENTISAIVVLLSMKHYIDRIKRNAHRHIYQKHGNNSTTFKEISRGSLAVWLATSPYVLHIFCLRNTSDASQRYEFLQKFYDNAERSDDFDTNRRTMNIRPSISFKIAENRQSSLLSNARYANASVPNLAAIDSSLRGTQLDFHKEQSIKLTYKSLSKSWSAAQLKRTLSPQQNGRLKRSNSKFARVDSNVTMYSRKSLGNKRKDDGDQTYGYHVPFDSPPVSMNTILNNFNKHYKLALKIQSRIRAPALVNKNNARTVVQGFIALSNGKDTIEKDDIVLKNRQSIIIKTLERIFVKCDIKGNRSIDIREFLYSQFGSANEEELDRAMSYNERMPRIYGWTVQSLKVLFDKIAKERYGWRNQQNKKPKSRLFLQLNDNEDEKKKDSEIRMSDFYALIIHCKELRQYVIRTTRLKRSKCKQMVTFKEACYIIFQECRGFHPESKKFQTLWSWVMKTEPGLNDEQIIQLKLLFDTMEQKADCTITVQQLENATEWIYPGLHTDKLLPYLFHKHHMEPTTRISCDDFLYFMGYVWCMFQNNFNRRKRNKTILDDKFTWIDRLRSTLSPSQPKTPLSRRGTSAMSKSFRNRPLSRMRSTGGTSAISRISPRSSRTNISRPNTRQTTLTDQLSTDSFDGKIMNLDEDLAETLKFAKDIKYSIKKAGDFSELGLSPKMKRYWNIVLSKANAEQAWNGLVLLSIRMVINNHKHNDKICDESIFAYMKVLENEDHHSDFKNTKFYKVPTA